jgi:hypothetical protein
VKQFRTISVSVVLHLPDIMAIPIRRTYHPMNPRQERPPGLDLILGNLALLRSIPREKTEDGTCSRLPFSSFIFPVLNNVFLVKRKRSTDCVP